MGKERMQKRANDDRVVRSYPQVAEQLRRRHGWNLSSVRVCQICTAAESKIWLAMMKLIAEEGL